VASYDPTLDIQRMTMPVLVLLGGKDRPALSLKWNDEWRSNLARGGNSDSTVVEFLNADHGAAVAGTHHQVHSGGPPTYVPGYLDMVDAWLRVHQTAPAAPAVDLPREQVVKIVAQIQRADYEGDRVALKRLYGELTPVAQDAKLASRVRYWRGFALWRRAMNGFNESVDPKELEEDLKQAVNEFDEAVRLDPGFVDGKVGAISCLSNLIFLNQSKPTRVQELVALAMPLRKEAEAAEPENCRLLWVLGPICWYAPPERGCTQDKAMDMIKKGLEAARKQKGVTNDPLEPSWGEPELLAALAWANLRRTTPDLNAAEQNARSALELVPYWHYVRDILIPQIQEAKKKPH